MKACEICPEEMIERFPLDELIVSPCGSSNRLVHVICHECGQEWVE